MDKTYNFTKALSLGGFKQTMVMPQKHLSVFDLRKILLFANVGWFFGVCLLVGVIYWTVGYAYQKELARKASLNEMMALEAQISDLNQQIQGLKDLNLRTVSQTLEYSSHLQNVLETSRGEERAFLLSLIPEALRIQVTHRIPASATIAMGIYESNYGRSDLARLHRNFFGIKALDPQWQGVRVVMPTRDRGVQTEAVFRGYSDLRGSVVGYAEFLRTSPYYRSAFSHKTGELFVEQILKGGYCPDSFYMGHIRNIMNRHQLQRLDFLNSEKFSPTPSTSTPELQAGSRGSMPIGMLP